MRKITWWTIILWHWVIAKAFAHYVNFRSTSWLKNCLMWEEWNTISWIDTRVLYSAHLELVFLSKKHPEISLAYILLCRKSVIDQKWLAVIPVVLRSAWLHYQSITIKLAGWQAGYKLSFYVPWSCLPLFWKDSSSS